MERNNLDLSGFPRLEDAEENYSITDWEINHRIEMARYWEKQQRRQTRENFFKWLMVAAGTVVIIVLALVWAGQLGATPRVYSVAKRVDAGRIAVRCLNGADATVEPPENFGELVVSCGTR